MICECGQEIEIISDISAIVNSTGFKILSCGFPPSALQ